MNTIIFKLTVLLALTVSAQNKGPNIPSMISSENPDDVANYMESNSFDPTTRMNRREERKQTDAMIQHVQKMKSEKDEQKKRTKAERREQRRLNRETAMKSRPVKMQEGTSQVEGSTKVYRKSDR